MGAIESVFHSTVVDLCVSKTELDDELPVTFKEKSEGKFGRLAYGSVSMQGWRMRNEDAHICIPELDPHDPNSPALFGVLDGHGGKGVARVTAARLPIILRKNPFFRKRDYSSALKSAFLEMDAYLSTHEGRLEVTRLDATGVDSQPDLQGCTCCVALIVLEDQISTVYCANVGDSRCVVGGDNLCVALSEDHKPCLPEERQRITKAGGCVARDIAGQWRINRGLNVSRALGDFYYKKPGLRPQDQIVSPFPDVTRYQWEMQPNSFLLIACDGIWERNSNAGAVKFIAERLEDDEFLSAIGGQLCDDTLATPAERRAPCINRGNQASSLHTGQDNMTVVIVKPTLACS